MILLDFEILELFQLVDADHGGTISRDEIAKLMKTLRYDASPEELDKMLNDIDLDHNGEIDPHEFISGFRRHGQMSIPPREIKAAFRVFAKHDGLGFITFFARSCDATYPPRSVFIT